MRHKTILIILLGLSIFAATYIFGNIASPTDFASPTPSLDNDSLLKSTWIKFANSVLNKDRKLFKQLSTNCIRCDHCVTNTQTEDSLFDIYRSKNEKTWYDKLYTEFCFIPIDKFINEDLNTIFTDNIKSRLLDTSKLNFVDDNHNGKLYSKPCIIGTTKEIKHDFREVLLLSIDPTPKYEGTQFAFAFVKINGQYKFCGFSTIP